MDVVFVKGCVIHWQGAEAITLLLFDCTELETLGQLNG